MKRIVRWSVAGAVAVVMASAVGAEEKAAATKCESTIQKVKSLFHGSDTDKNGKLTAAEHKAQLENWLKEMDADHDGKVSAAEFNGSLMIKIDTDKDGSVTMEEFLVFFAGEDAATSDTPACKRLDADGDGELTAVEIVAYRKSVFAEADIDSDGKITANERKGRAAKQFKALDADKDGFITIEEMIMVIPVKVEPMADQLME